MKGTLFDPGELQEGALKMVKKPGLLRISSSAGTEKPQLRVVQSDVVKPGALITVDPEGLMEAEIIVYLDKPASDMQKEAIRNLTGKGATGSFSEEKGTLFPAQVNSKQFSQTEKGKERKEEGSRSHGDSKNSVKRKGKVFVLDVRSKTAAAKEKSGMAVKDPAQFESKQVEDHSQERSRSDMVRSFDTKQDVDLSSQPARPLLTKSDQTVLLKNLKQQLNSDIVKNASIILKNQSSGEIRLVLKPEKFGTVRIWLNLQDNHIAGKIIVENNIVREAFENNLESLYRAFRENGFETSGLDVSLGRGRGETRREQERDNPMSAQGVKILDEHVPAAQDVSIMEYTINLMV